MVSPVSALAASLSRYAVPTLKRPGLMPLLFESRRMCTNAEEDRVKSCRPEQCVWSKITQGEYSSLTAAAAVVAKQFRVSKESVPTDKGLRHLSTTSAQWVTVAHHAR